MAIVLVTYRGEAYLDRLYTSIHKLEYPRGRYRLLVIDNGPEHALQRWFSQHAPDVRVITPGHNTGYAGGATIGMLEALAWGVDYVAVITQDVLLDPAWLRELLAVAERHPRAGAIQPKILRGDQHGGTVINTWGNELHFLGVGFSGGDGCPDQPLAIRPVPYASGAGLLLRASALRAVGVFDPEFFMYHEDTDLSWRLRLNGYDILLAPRAVMFHAYDFKKGADKFYYIERNRLINIFTHYRFRTLALISPALVAFEIMVLAYAFRHGWLRTRLAVYAFFLRAGTWVYLRRKRRQVQSIRRVRDRVIVDQMTGWIDFGALQSSVLRYVVNPLFSAYWRLVRRLIVW